MSFMNIGIITAGGSGKRMQTNDIPKQFLLVCNKPIIIYTLEHFERCKDIDGIVISCLEDWIPHLKKLVDDFRISKVKDIVKGGKSGQSSIYNAILAAKKIVKDEACIVLVHDGVRPLISTELISDSIQTVKEYGSCITTAPVNETIACVCEVDRKVKQVLDRDNLVVARAPQSFWLDDLLALHTKANNDNRHNFVDSCQMANYYGKELEYIEGPHDNIKITTLEDYYILRTIIQTREDKQFMQINMGPREI